MYCKHCGAPLGGDTKRCPACGGDQTAASLADTGNAGWGVLGFFLPLIGFILFLVWRNDRPRTARVAGIGALVNVILYLVALVLLVVAIFVLGALPGVYNVRLF